MDAYVLLGGPKEQWPYNLKQRFCDAKSKGDLLIGVDRGALFLLQLGITPDLAIGDFDSLRNQELSLIENRISDIRYSVPKKDWTDSELMLKIAFEDYKLDNVRIFGATGGRIDHFLINLFTVLNPDIRLYANHIILEDRQNEIIYRLAGSHKIKNLPEFYYFGVTCLGPVKNLKIQGALYNLNSYSGNYLRSFTSNEFLPGTAGCQISLDEGIIAIIYSKDLNRFDNLN